MKGVEQTAYGVLSFNGSNLYQGTASLAVMATREESRNFDFQRHTHTMLQQGTDYGVMLCIENGSSKIGWPTNTPLYLYALAARWNRCTRGERWLARQHTGKHDMDQKHDNTKAVCFIINQAWILSTHPAIIRVQVIENLFPRRVYHSFWY